MTSSLQLPFKRADASAAEDAALVWDAATARVQVSTQGAFVDVGATNLSYTAATRILASDTGTDVTLPLVTSTDAGLAPASGGGTANFLRADLTWAVPAGDLSAACILQADYTLANVGTAQKIFNSSANGAVTLATGFYTIDLMLWVTGMSATSGNAGLGLGGTAIGSRILYKADGWDAAIPMTATAAMSGRAGNTLAGHAGHTATAAVATEFLGHYQGSFDCTTGGTLIPQITLVTAVATAVVKAGSRVIIRRIGATATAMPVGTWS